MAITNGQVIGTRAVTYSCGFLGKDTCYQYNTFRVRRFKNRLLITRSYESRAGNSPGELVLNEARINEEKDKGTFSIDFRQSELFSLLAKQPVLSNEGFVNDETQLSSVYTEDNETVLVPSMFTTTGGTVTNPNNPSTGDGGGNGDGNGDDNGLTLDQLLPYIAGGVILLAALAIVLVTKRRR